MIDVDAQIQAVRRHVGTRTLEPGEARTLRISQTYATSAEDLWEVCTDPERIARWFLPVSGELREGGHYALEGNASGTITACDPPRRFDATWEMGGQTSWIVVTVEPAADGGATFTLEHLALLADVAHWDEQGYGPGAVGVGWDGMLAGLALFTTSGPFDRGAAEAYFAGPEGARFFDAVAHAWGDADAASGTDPETARKGALATSAFYRGVA